MRPPTVRRRACRCPPDGGAWPCWSVDGRTLYFSAGGQAAAAAVQTAPALRVSAPMIIPGRDDLQLAGGQRRSASRAGAARAGRAGAPRVARRARVVHRAHADRALAGVRSGRPGNGGRGPGPGTEERAGVGIRLCFRVNRHSAPIPGARLPAPGRLPPLRKTRSPVTGTRPRYMTSTIASLTDPRVREYLSVANPAAIERAGLFVAEGRFCRAASRCTAAVSDSVAAHDANGSLRPFRRGRADVLADRRTRLHRTAAADESRSSASTSTAAVSALAERPAMQMLEDLPLDTLTRVLVLEG